jgi:hypothetical protein
MSSTKSRRRLTGRPSSSRYTTQPHGDALAIARRLFAKHLAVPAGSGTRAAARGIAPAAMLTVADWIERIGFDNVAPPRNLLWDRSRRSALFP